MKTLRTCLGAILMMLAGDALTLAQAPPSSATQPPASPSGAAPAANAPASPSATAPTNAAASTAPGAAPAANPAAPPSAPPQKSDADLDKLVAPIALYPDPLLATVLPASAYPLEIVQAARFVKDTNNIAKLDSQPWDDNVKAVAKFPDVINQMNDNIQWTSDLGDAFINQPKGVTDAIQRMRTKAQGSGALKTTEQQVVTVTNTIVTNIVEQVPVYVTNQVVQVQPAQPDVVYVPQYNPTVVYAGYPAAYPGYVSPPYYPVASAAVTFGLGMAAGAIVANNCDWGHGGCWGGSYHSDVNVNRNVNVNNTANVNRSGNANVNRGANANANGQKWQPDSNRLKNSGSTMSSAQNREARGYGSGANQSTAAAQRSGSPATRSGSTTPRASSGSSQLSPTGPSGDRQSSPSANRPSSSPNANRPSSSQSANRPSSSQSASRPSSSQSASRPSPSQTASRPSSSGSSQSAFTGGGGGGSQTRQASSRGSASRGGGGGRGGGGRR